MKTKLHHIHIRCQDVEASFDFYRGVLGAALVDEIVSLGTPIKKLDLGGLPLFLSPAKEGLAVREDDGLHGWGLFQIAVQVEDLDRMKQEAAQKGWPFSSGPVQAREGLRVAFMPAPDGVEIELMEFS